MLKIEDVYLKKFHHFFKRSKKGIKSTWTIGIQVMQSRI